MIDTDSSQQNLAAKPTIWPVTLVGAVIAISFVLGGLRAADWDITLFLTVGEDSVEFHDWLEPIFGEVHQRAGFGHDGKYFFVQALDPWILDPDTPVALLDRPIYRSQRMLYPTLAGGLGLLTPPMTLYGMIGVNVLAMVLGTWATAIVALQMGLSRWWGMAFTLNLGFLSELNVSGAGALAGALAFGAVALLLNGRYSWATAALALSALTRETMLIAVVGSAWWLWRHRCERQTAVSSLSVPLVVALAWFLYVRMRLGWQIGADEIKELGWPFVGFMQAFRVWVPGDLFSLVVGIVLLAALLGFAARAVRDTHLLGWAFVGFAALGLVMTRHVWLWASDIARAVAPAITSYVLLVLASRPSASVREGTKATAH